MRNLLKNKRLLTLFCRHLAKYLLILMLLLVLLLPMLGVSYENIRQNILSSHTANLNQIANEFDSRLLNIVSFGKIISGEKSYQNLLASAGPIENRRYLDMNSLQAIMTDLALSHEYIMDMYLLFWNNPVYISNFISADDYHSVYPTFIRVKDLDAEAWHRFCFSGNSSYQFAQMEVESFYSKSYTALTCIYQLPQYNHINKGGVLICNINLTDMADRLMMPEIKDESLFYISDPNGRIIGSYHYPGQNDLSASSCVIDGRKYDIVSSDKTSSGYRFVMGIPEMYFRQRIRSSYSIIAIYGSVGLGLIMILSFVLSFRETNSVNAVLTAASELFPLPESLNKNFDEYDFLSSSLRNSASELETRNQIARIYAVESLFLNPSPGDFGRIRDLLGATFEIFCVSVLRFSQTDDAAPYSLSYLEGECRVLMERQFLSAYTDIDELALLIPLEDTQMDTLNALQAELRRVLDHISTDASQTNVLHIGVSPAFTGISNVHAAYEQAKNAILHFASRDISDMFIFNDRRADDLQPLLDMSLPLKCYEAIVCGDESAVKLFFDNISKAIQECSLVQSETYQILYSARQPVLNAFIWLAPTDEDIRECPPPGIDINRSVKHNIEVLEESALRLCKYVLRQKSLRQTETNQDIMTYIKTECFDANFSVYMVTDKFHVSENYVLKLVKEVTGYSFKTYVETVRVEKAETLLCTTNEPNAKIAMLCGFGSENTFYRAFSRKHGVTPSKWSQSNANQRSQSNS